MARLVFILIVVAVTAMVWHGRHSAHGRAWNRILLLAFAALVVFTILFPETTTVVANWMGIGRGTDLVFYLTSFALMFVTAAYYLRFRQTEERIAGLTADFALRDWNREVERLNRMEGPATPAAWPSAAELDEE